MRPAIVIVAYNRPKSLTRVLYSLGRGHYPEGTPLIISIDKSDTDTVETIARDFAWEHGEKTVIAHSTQLGLRNHILSCGDLSQDYEGLILLEDDLFLSPHFYSYAEQALYYYSEEHDIAGVSLFNQGVNATMQLPMIPISDTGDTFFMQMPSSWGFAWTARQWARFRKWYLASENLQIDDSTQLPRNVLDWPETSWCKYFFKYVVETNRYCVFPRTSLSTNFMDAGIHCNYPSRHLQTPLEQQKKKYIFADMDRCNAIYDVYCETKPEFLKARSSFLKNYDFEVDLYGAKDISLINKDFLLTSKPCSNPIREYGLYLKPHELNIVYEIDGHDIRPAKTADCASTIKKTSRNRIHFYFSMPWSMIDPSREHLKAAESKVKLLLTQKRDLKASLSEKTKVIEDMRSSKSWKITKPLRRLKKVLRPRS